MGGEREGLMDWHGVEGFLLGVGPTSCPAQRLRLKIWQILLLLIVSHIY